MNDFDSDLHAEKRAAESHEQAEDSHLHQWLQEKDPGTSARPAWNWPVYDDSSWQQVELPGAFKALPGADKPSLVWLRKEIDLPYGINPGSAVLDLGPVNSIDDTYVNGIWVGGQPWGPWSREYQIPSGVLEQGRNVIAIRVVAPTGGDYVGSKPQDLHLTFGGQTVSLAGSWRAKMGIDLSQPGMGPKSYGGFPDLPTVLYNGMLYPVAPLAIKGAIWYQGESNADRPYQYRMVLPLMISDWRRTFQEGDFPFYIVSLASFMGRQKDPHDDSWAELREAQALTAERVPESGLAVTTDVGSADDIHPKDKETVGNRLALIALAKSFHERIPYSGPVFDHMSIRGNGARLEFRHTDGGLVLRGDAADSFELAGSDRKWYWADARLDGNTVVLTSPSVARPVAARYAWQANPPAPLYNGAGLPAVPFRTDDWPGVTFHKE